MTLTPSPRPDDLPSPARLVRATVGAVAVAGIILVTAVLPAEYGIDPTGVGRLLGLTQMGELKQAETQASEAAAVAPPAPAPAPATASTPAPVADGVKTDEIALTLQPNEGTEVKAVMKTGEEFDYTWSTDGPEVRFELHGEPLGAAASVFTSYEKGVSTGASGKFRAPFDGTHGWFWRNRNPIPIKITVRVTGQYDKVSHVK